MNGTNIITIRLVYNHHRNPLQVHLIAYMIYGSVGRLAMNILIIHQQLNSPIKFTIRKLENTRLIQYDTRERETLSLEVQCLKIFTKSAFQTLWFLLSEKFWCESPHMVTEKYFHQPKINLSADTNVLNIGVGYTKIFYLGQKVRDLGFRFVKSQGGN